MRKKGLVGDKYNLLRREEIEKIHKSSLWVLEEIGVRVDDDHFLTLFEQTGANVDKREKMVVVFIWEPAEQRFIFWT